MDISVLIWDPNKHESETKEWLVSRGPYRCGGTARNSSTREDEGGGQQGWSLVPATPWESTKKQTKKTLINI